MSNSTTGNLKEIDLSVIITNHTKCLENAARFRSLLSDRYPNYRDTYEDLGGTHEKMGGVHTFYKDLTCQLVAM